MDFIGWVIIALALFAPLMIGIWYLRRDTKKLVTSQEFNHVLICPQCKHEATCHGYVSCRWQVMEKQWDGIYRYRSCYCRMGREEVEFNNYRAGT